MWILPSRHVLCRLDFCLGTGWTIAGAGIPYVLVALLNGWRVMGPLAYLSQSGWKMAAGGSGGLEGRDGK